MKVMLILLNLFFTLSLQANSACDQSLQTNPLLQKSQLDLEAFRFDLIKLEHFKPALKQSYEMADQRLNQLLTDQNPPSLVNTIEALLDLDREFENVQYLLSVYSSHLTTPDNQELLTELDELETELNLKLTQKIYTNALLYQRFKTVSLLKNLNTAQKKFLKEQLESFERNGLNFSPQQLAEYQMLSQALSAARTSFQNKNQDQDRLANNYLHVTNRSELEGLPERTLLNGQANANKLGLTGWVFSPADADYVDILDSAKHESLRFKMWYLGSTSNARGDQFDTSIDVKSIIKLEQKLAQLQGFPTPAEKHLDGNMAKTADQVKAFYRGFIQQSFIKAKADLQELQNFKNRISRNRSPLEKWDYRFWLNQYRKANFGFDEDQFRPYLEFSKVLNGVFKIVYQLYGIEFVARLDLPKFHPELHIYELKKSNQSIGLLYFDPFSRDEKQSGAWMSSLVAHEKLKDGRSQPIISIISTDFQKSVSGATYLKRENVITLLHEMGHALHSFASTAENRNQSGTRGVSRDMVELPSQFMENYFFEYEVLKQFATNDQGRPVPRSLFDAMMKARLFGQGQKTLQQLLTSGLDIELFSQPQLDESFTILAFEDQIFSPYQLFPKTPEGLIRGQHLNTFSHIMMGGYTAQYYSYLWSEVLAFDAFGAFKEAGNIFDPSLAKKFEKLLAAGSTQDADVIYREFRGRDLSYDAFLKAKGLSLP